MERAVEGWCQYPEQPNERATVEFLVNGAVVRAMRATRLRLDRRDIGMGDGYCGFSFPFSPAGGDEKQVLEVRETRSNLFIGRIVLGSQDAAMNRRLDALAATLAAIDVTLASPSARSPLVEATGALGRTLLHLSGRPAPQRKLGLPGLQASLARVAEIPAMNLGWRPSPKFSLIVRADGDLIRLAARIRAAAFALEGLGAQFLLLDDGALPEAALLPTRMRNLLLVPCASLEDLGPAFNAAVTLAHGKFLAFAGPGGPAPAGLREALESARVGQPALSRETRGQSLQGVVSRADFMDLGGFEPIRREDAMWASFRAKAQALALPIAPLRSEPARSG